MVANAGDELSASEWRRVFAEASEMGVLQVGISEGEPLGHRDLTEIIAAARDSALYTNLITSGVGLDELRLRALCEAGLDSVQLSFQADEPVLADGIAGTEAHCLKLRAAVAVRGLGMPLSLNVVLHRWNLGRLSQIITFAEELGAERLELANVQFYGWAFRNREHLLPTRQQVDKAAAIAQREKARLAGRMEIFYVKPDYYADRPKPCMAGWGRRYLTVNPTGDVLPCPNAGCIRGLRFERT
jgi:pyrroloquinoline quinone biosynthesis protein E